MTKSSFDAESIKKDILSGVGYARPPHHTRFQKGKSGNPLGRPRKTATMVSMSEPNSGLGANTEIMRQVLSEPVKVRVNGRVRNIPKAEAAQRSLEKQALGGRFWATRELKKELEAEDARRVAELESDHSFWETYLQHYNTELAHSKKMGIPMRGFWIEPENIMIRTGKLVETRGPRLEGQIHAFGRLQHLLKAYLVKFIYDMIAFPKQTSVRPELKIYFLALWTKANSLMTAQMAVENLKYWDFLEELSRHHSAFDAELKARWTDIGEPPPIHKPLLLPPPPPRIQKKLRAIFRNDLTILQHFEWVSTPQRPKLKRYKAGPSHR